MPRSTIDTIALFLSLALLQMRVSVQNQELALPRVVRWRRWRPGMRAHCHALQPHEPQSVPKRRRHQPRRCVPRSADELAVPQSQQHVCQSGRPQVLRGPVEASELGFVRVPGHGGQSEIELFAERAPFVAMPSPQQRLERRRGD